MRKMIAAPEPWPGSARKACSRLREQGKVQMGTMMALRAHARGGPEQLVCEQAPVPSAGPGEALIAVHAAAITFAELTWDLEWTTWDGADRTPVIPSHEMSGTVAGLGDGVAGLAAGDEVIGLVGRSWRAGTRSALCSSSSSRTSASWPGWRSWPARERCER